MRLPLSFPAPSKAVDAVLEAVQNWVNREATPLLRQMRAALQVMGDAAVNVALFGADPTGAVDSTVAIQKAIDAATNGQGDVFFPAGTYLVTDTLTISSHGTHLRGVGKLQTIIKFMPFAIDEHGNALVNANGETMGTLDSMGVAVAQECFRFKLPTATVLSGCSLTGMTMVSGPDSAGAYNTVAKVAVATHDVSEFHLADMRIVPWTGTDSTGWRSYGREIVTVERNTASCDIPVRLSINPNTSYLCWDRYRIQGNYWTGASLTRPVILVDNGTAGGAVTFASEAWVNGHGGLLWEDDSSLGITAQWSFEQVEYEQGAAIGGWAMKISKTGASQSILGVTLTNFFTGAGDLFDGFYFRKCPHVLNHVIYNGIAPRVAINIDGSATPAEHINTHLRLSAPAPTCNYNLNGVDGALEVWSVPQGSGAAPYKVVYGSEALAANFRTMQLVGTQFSTKDSPAYDTGHWFPGDFSLNTATVKGGIAGWVAFTDADATLGNPDIQWTGIPSYGRQTFTTSEAGANPADIATITVPDNQGATLRVTVNARRTGGTRGTGAVGDFAGFTFSAPCSKKGAGATTLSLVGSVGSYVAADSSKIDPDLALCAVRARLGEFANGEALVHVDWTPASGITLDWVTTFEIIGNV